MVELFSINATTSVFSYIAPSHKQHLLVLGFLSLPALNLPYTFRLEVRRESFAGEISPANETACIGVRICKV